MNQPRNTRLLWANRPEDLEEAAGIIREGGLVAFPTETVYGLGANALDPGAVAGIFAAKGRPQDNPLIVHVAQEGDIASLVTSCPPGAGLLMERFWPGPLTLILPRRGRIPPVISGGLDTVAVRMPSHPVARELIARSGVPVAAPSANRSGSPSPTTAAHCVADLEGRVDAVLDGGACPVGVESTVLSLVGDVPRLLRPGAVTVEQLREVLGSLEVDPAVTREADPQGPVASPGMKYKHYAPRAEMELVHGSLGAVIDFLERHNSEGVYALVFDEDRGEIPVPCVTYGGGGQPEQQAERLFSALRELDRLGARRVYARPPRPEGVGLAVYNRLIRAAGFRERYLESHEGE